jgi:hypothetical protein
MIETNKADLGQLGTGARQLINNPSTIKIVATVDRDGRPHAAPKGTLRVLDDGLIEYAELLESSRSYKNITGSIWFERKVAVLVIAEDKSAFEITGRVDSITVAGAKFEEVYRNLSESKGFDVAAVITIIPEAVEDLNIKDKFAEQDKNHIFFTHLDRGAI